MRVDANRPWRVSVYEPVAVPAQVGRLVAGDWEQCVEQLVKKLLDATTVWFPYLGEGRRPKGDANNPCILGDARFLDDRLNVSKYITGLGPPEETPWALC